jgi:lysophospholipase L1-like esterase
MNPAAFIAIGGCHVTGFGVQPHESFIHLLSDRFNLECTLQKSHFQIKHVAKIRDLISEHQPEVVLLQLGNFDYHSSLKRLFKKKKKDSAGKPSSSSSSSMPSKNQLREQFIVTPVDKEPFYKRMVRSITLPFIASVLQRRYAAHLEVLGNIIERNRKVRFIVMAPMPCIKWNDNYVRYRGAKEFKQLFALQPNVHFIDLHHSFERNRSLFQDPFHLNASGHQRLFQLIAKSLESSRIITRQQAPGRA